MSAQNPSENFLAVQAVQPQSLNGAAANDLGVDVTGWRYAYILMNSGTVGTTNTFEVETSADSTNGVDGAWADFDSPTAGQTIQVVLADRVNVGEIDLRYMPATHNWIRVHALTVGVGLVSATIVLTQSRDTGRFAAAPAASYRVGVDIT